MVYDKFYFRIGWKLWFLNIEILYEWIIYILIGNDYYVIIFWLGVKDNRFYLIKVIEIML